MLDQNIGDIYKIFYFQKLAFLLKKLLRFYKSFIYKKLVSKLIFTKSAFAVNNFILNMSFCSSLFYCM